MNLDDEFKKATQYRKEKKYHKAIAVYKTCLQQSEDAFNEWDLWSFAYSLFYVKQYSQALDVCRKGYLKYPDFTFNNSLYARCIYYSQLKTKDPPNFTTSQKAVDAIIKLSPLHDVYSISARAIFEFSKIAMRQIVIPWETIERYLLMLNPDQLSAEPFSLKTDNGKQIGIASEKEQWYAQMIKVKAGQQKAHDLLELVNKTKALDLKWHYNNDIWFARKEAFAYQQLGDVRKATSILQNIIARKREWFLLYDLGKITKDKKFKLQLFAEAALTSGPFEMKLKLYESLYEEIIQYDQDLAHSHICFIMHIRKKNGWPIRGDATLGINEGECFSQNFKEILARLRKEWKLLLPKREVYQGVVLRILSNGKSGFLKTENKTYYTTFDGLREIPKVGDQVTFTLMDSFDKKKQKASSVAVSLTKVNS